MFIDLSSPTGFAVNDQDIRLALANPHQAPRVFREAVEVLVTQTDSTNSNGLWEWLHTLLGEVLVGLDREAQRHVIDSLTTAGDVVWSLVGRQANALAVLYNFMPFADTGSTVASKRLRQFGDVFDVFSCDMSGRKSIDPTVNVIAEPYIDEHKIAPMTPTWANVRGIQNFALRAHRFVDDQISRGKSYDYMYTRAMWIDSIYAGARIKSAYPDLPWVVEFSDPLSLDVEGRDRTGSEPSGEFYTQLLDPISAQYGHQDRFFASVFGAAEFIAYSYADELIFTNALQRQTMIDLIENPVLKQRVESISRVSNHPTLPEQYYSVSTVDYTVRSDVMNIGYFGEFYANRGLQDVTRAIAQIDGKSRIHLHVFTDYAPGASGDANGKMAERVRDGLGGDDLDFVHINQSLPYLRFLAATEKFDYLIVTDARSGEKHEVNPYLPSKWSDYKGSSARTWALVEPGSSLDSMDPAVKSMLGNDEQTQTIISDMLNELLSRIPARESHANIELLLDSPRAVSAGRPDPENRPFDGSGADEDAALAILSKHAGRVPDRGLPLYEPDQIRVLDILHGEAVPAPMSNQIVQIPIRVGGFQGFDHAGCAQLFWAHGRRPETAAFLLAGDIAAHAKRHRIGMIVASFHPLLAFSAFLAARWVGVPFGLNLVRDDAEWSDAVWLPEDNEPTPTKALLTFVLRHSDLIIADGDPLRRIALQAGVSWTQQIEPEHLSEIEEGPNTDGLDERFQEEKNNARPRAVLVGSGAGFEFGHHADVEVIDFAELAHFDPTRSEIPELLVVDARELDRCEGLDTVLWRMGGIGVNRVMLLDDSGIESDFLLPALKQTDVVIGTSNSGCLRLTDRATYPTRGFLSLPTAGWRVGSAWNSWAAGDSSASERAALVLRAIGLSVDIPIVEPSRFPDFQHVSERRGESQPQDSRELPQIDLGISLILATYQGRDRITTMLDSIASQTLPSHLIEVIVVVNGEPDGTDQIVAQWSADRPWLDLKLVVIEEAGVARARNAGLAKATRDWVTFIDDDDYLGSNYLLSMYVRRVKDGIVLGRLTDVTESGDVDAITSQNQNVSSIGRQVVSLASRWHVLSLNAGKLIPARFAQDIRYETHLRSGEDQVYMVELLKFDPSLTAARPMPDSAYMRVRRPGSISRRASTFDFAVKERLDVMTSLRVLSEKHDSRGVRRASEGIGRWHELAISRFAFAPEHADDIPKVKKAIQDAGFDPRRVLHREVVERTNTSMQGTKAK